MQATVPIHLVGKHTAYAVKLAPEDFATWDALLAARNWPGGLSMSKMAMATMDIFRSSNPTRFYELYGVPPENQNETDWFANMQEVRVRDRRHDGTVSWLIPRFRYIRTLSSTNHSQIVSLHLKIETEIQYQIQLYHTKMQYQSTKVFPIQNTIAKYETKSTTRSRCYRA